MKKLIKIWLYFLVIINLPFVLVDVIVAIILKITQWSDEILNRWFDENLKG